AGAGGAGGDRLSTPPGPWSEQGRLFELLLGLLERLSDERPALLVVEDLHWADRSTRDLLAFLHRNLRHGRLLLVMTYRSDELHRRHPLRPFLAELDRGRRVDRRGLGRGAVSMPCRADDLPRRHPLRPFLAELDRGRRVDRLELDRFGRDELAAQLAGVQGGAAAGGLTERVHARS